jgi:hypothetical protein
MNARTPDSVPGPSRLEPRAGDCVAAATYLQGRERNFMGRFLLLWLLGIPLPILVIIWLIGGFH